MPTVNEYNETEYHPFYSDNEYSIVANKDRLFIVIALCFKIFDDGLVLPDINVVRTYGRIRSYKRVLWVWYHARRTISGDINYEVNYSFNSAIGIQKIEVDEEIEAKKGYSRSVFKSVLTPEYSTNVKFIEIDSKGTTPSTGNAKVNCN